MGDGPSEVRHGLLDIKELVETENGLAQIHPGEVQRIGWRLAQVLAVSYTHLTLPTTTYV